MTGYADYLFLLSPPQTIMDEVARYRKASAKYIGDFMGVHSPAHISLAQVERQKPYFADSTLGRMEQRLTIMPTIQLHIDGFKYFNHLHDKKTIYAAIRNTQIADSWFELMKKNLGIKKAILPHITVCRNITDEEFKTLWPHFRHKKWTESFWVNELTVTRRETFEPYAKWQTIKKIPFKGNGLQQGINAPTGRDEQINLF
ncbi:MAG: 2'-5' RNA ligase family protein [Mucilaginibacter sp.]|nr:2'-5' RNA ligase family protein [Mucilaginibacter sp.]